MSGLRGPGSGGARTSPQMMGTRVLLVTDEPDSGRIWAFALRQMGLEVVLTNRSQDALEESE
jgi:CheY-like chemotaxis protein